MKVLETNRGGVKTSENYKFFSSKDIVDSFQGQGYTLESVKATRTRNELNEGFQKHFLTFSKPELDNGPTKLNLLVTNSHDGSGSLTINVGIFRLVCSNGLVVGNSMWIEKVRHFGNNAMIKLGQAVDNSGRLLPLVAEQIEVMKSTIVNQDIKREMAKKALLLRSDKIILNDSNISQVLTMRRNEDTQQDLFTVYNVIQENIIRGGLKFETLNNEGINNVVTMRKIRGISRDVELNKGLWNIASEQIAA